MTRSTDAKRARDSCETEIPSTLLSTAREVAAPVLLLLSGWAEGEMTRLVALSMARMDQGGDELRACARTARNCRRKGSWRFLMEEAYLPQ